MSLWERLYVCCGGGGCDGGDFFTIISMKGVVVFCFLKIKNGISSYSKVTLRSHFPIWGLAEKKYLSLSKTHKANAQFFVKM